MNNKKHPKPEEILLIPRREVELVSNNENPPTFLMVARKDKYSKGLRKASKECNTGLSSGIRSAIIYDDKKQSYIKIKGVNLFPTLKERKIGDGTSASESEFHTFTGRVPPEIFTYVDLEPVATKRFLRDISITDYNNQSFYQLGGNNKYFQTAVMCKKKQVFLSKITTAKIGVTYDFFSEMENLEIPYFKIKGDTRLDEIIYTLTLHKEKNTQIKDITNLLQRFCENGAYAYCKAFMAGAAFDRSPSTYTEVHIGNIVYRHDHNIIKSTIVDLPSFLLSDNVSKMELKNVWRVFRSFSWDFWDDTLGSLPHIKYKNFTDEQRDLCTKAFYNGYKKFLKIIDKQEITPAVRAQVLDGIKEHQIPKDELDHYIKDKVIRQ